MVTTNPLAVVTGASSGIGLELAQILAENGFDLLLTAEDGLALPSARLRDSRVSVDTVQADLATYDGVEKLCGAVAATGRPVNVLALNAGVGQGGAFLETDLADQTRVIDLNITSSVHLARRLMPEMVAHDEGRVLITSSIAATMPGSFQAVYNASKSFLQSFAQALEEELSHTSVTVTSLMPGPTETDFFRRAGMEDTPLGRRRKDSPRLVAQQGFEAMMAGRSKIIAGSAGTRAEGLANKVLPDRLKAAMHRRMAEPESKRETKGTR